jgi:hypothetical protein
LGTVLALAVSLFALSADAQPAITEPARVALAAGEVLIDQAVASITIAGDDGPPVFVYESELRVAVRALLASSGAPDPLTTEVHESVTGSVLGDLIGEKLLEREALRADDPAVSATLTADTLRQFEARIAPVSLAALASACGTTADAVARSVVRKATVGQFLRMHQPRLLEPVETEMRAAFERGRWAPYPNDATDYRSVRSFLRERLINDAQPRAVRSVLRAMGPTVRIRRWPLVL